MGVSPSRPAKPSAMVLGARNESRPIDLSVIIPIFNEAPNLPVLEERLTRVLDQLGRPAEVCLVDDGSTDGSLALLLGLAKRDPRFVVVELARNAGQHSAVVAGFAASRGAIVVTLDGDLQNPPEEIPRLVAKIEEGYEVVGTWRENRNDPFLRRFVSALVNRITAVTVGVNMRDYGCMLRAYRREIVDQIVACDERALFIPALANTLTRRVAEIEVSHSERASGRSKYRPLMLMRLGFDLLTGFSLLPIQLVSIAGVFVSLAGVGFGLFLLARRLFVGPEVEGVFTLFAILFVFLGLLIFAVGLVGEYIGRIYMEVRRRPSYRVRAVHRQEEAPR